MQLYSSSSAREIHNVRTIVADCGFVFWGRNENEILFGNSQKCLRQWSEWNFWRAINAQCVTRVGTVFFGKIPWRASPWIFHLWSVTQGFHTRASIRQLLRNFWFGTIARKGACTVISRKFPRSVDIVAWPVHWRRNLHFAHLESID